MPVMFFLTMVMYRTGSSLDWLFDPVLAPKTDTNIPSKWMGKKMRSARTRAAWFIMHGPWDKKEDPVLKADGKKAIYSKAEILYDRESADWKKKVKWFLEISKSARSFILPHQFRQKAWRHRPGRSEDRGRTGLGRFRLRETTVP